MMSTESNCYDLVKTYTTYLEQDFVISDYQNNSCQVITPFWRPDGDHIEFFIVTQSDGSLLLTDEGQTFDWLFSVGMEIQGNKGREELISQIAIRHNITIRNGVFSLPVNPKAAGVSVHRFLTALKAISHLTLLRQQRGKPSFRDEVEFYLIENGQEYRSNFKVIGKTVEHTIPFYLNSERNWLVEAISATSLASARTALYKVTFEWIDIRAGEQNYQMVTVIDDSGEKWDEIWSKNRVRLPMEEYSDRIIRWSQRTQLLGSLA